MMNQKIEKPITYDELYEKIKKIIKKQDELDTINNAYAFALNKHAGKKRRNGDDYVTHPLEVANILTDLKLKNPVIIGHSFGGKVALAYATKYKVDKLVLLASPYRKKIQKESLKESFDKLLETIEKNFVVRL